MNAFSSLHVLDHQFDPPVEIGFGDLWIWSIVFSPLLIQRAASSLSVVMQSISYRLPVEVAENALLCTTVWSENKHQGIMIHLCLVLPGILLLIKMFFCIWFLNSYNPNPFLKSSETGPQMSSLPPPPPLSLSLALFQGSFCNQDCHCTPLLVIPFGALAAWNTHAGLKLLCYQPFDPIHVVGHRVAFSFNLTGCTCNFGDPFSYSLPAILSEILSEIIHDWCFWLPDLSIQLLPTH